ncbi:MAG: DUF3857 domain-containing protein [Chitinophagaceae bacterium]
MKRKLALLLLCSLSSLLMKAGEGEYAVARIPVLLLKGAQIVIRQSEYVAELQSLDKLVIHRHFVITVLNEDGVPFSRLTESYDKFSEIKNIEGALYDAAGNKLKSLKNKDVEDVSGTSGMSLAGDSRLKLHSFYSKDFPYTVEYFVEELQKQTMFFPSWVPVWSDNVAVEKSSITFIAPKNYLVRYREFNYPSGVVVKEDNDRKVYKWAISNYPAVTREFASPGWKEITPQVMLAPSNFTIEDYSGNMTDWKELGKFQNALNVGRDKLPDNIKQKVSELTSKTTTVAEKTKVLYSFLQSSTRYISIQLGIGGWRPFDASYVASKSYGDCKALSNYMYALLKEAGVQSFYTLIKAGDYEEDIITDFPSRQFNHAILCVPDGKDTIWLECTSQDKAPGYMGGFTGNRHALLITEDGGRLVPTPRYNLHENQQVRRITATLDEEASLFVKVKTSYKAMEQDDLQMIINALSKDKVKEFLHEQLDFATYDIRNFEYKENKSALPSVEESLDVEVTNYATITGKRLFIIPNIMTRHQRKLSADSSRKYDLRLRHEYINVDSVEINLPPGYIAESLPKDATISSKFGKYFSSVKLTGSTINYYRHIEHYGGRFPASDYPELVRFYEAIYKADRNKVVLVKNEAPKGF